MAQARLYLQRDLTVHVNALSQDLVRRGVFWFLRWSLVLSTLTSEKPLRTKCLENILSGGGIDTKLAPFNTEYSFFFSFLPNLLLIYCDQQQIGRV